MMSSFLPYLILSCMLCKTVVTLVLVSADKSSPANGMTVTLTCDITSFTLPSFWINDASSGILSICPRAGTCSPTTSGRYSYSATSSTIVVQITAFDALSDNFGWKCQHDTDTDIFKFTFRTTSSSTSSTTATTATMTTTAATLSTTNTEMRTTNIDTRTRNTEMTTNTEIGRTQSIETTSLCPPPVLVIIGVSVSGFLSILLIFIIIICCYPCCCLYHCRKKQNTDKYRAELVETNDNEDAKNYTKAKAGTPNPAYVQINVPNKSSTSDKFKEVQPVDRTVNILIQSSSPTVNQTPASDQVWEDKSVPNKNDINESVWL